MKTAACCRILAVAAAFSALADAFSTTTTTAMLGSQQRLHQTHGHNRSPSYSRSYASTQSVGLSDSSFCRRPSSTPSPGNSQRQRQRQRQRHRQGSSLTMHFGHSHSHSHHHHGHGHGHERSHAASAVAVKDPAAIARRRRRRVAMLLFAALCTLGPSAVMRSRALTRADWGAFCVVSAVLASTDKIKSAGNSLVFKLRQWRDGFVKHAPNDATKPQSLLDFVFRNDNAADRVTLVGVLVNLVLSAGKFAVGVTCHSSALIADAGHSLSDLFSDFVTLYSVQIARLPPDDDHPYGHGKFEAIGSLFLALTLIGTGVSVGAMANKELFSILHMQRASGSTAAAASKLIHVPKPPALLMAAISIVSKEWLFRITRRVGERINSQVVIANAWHHRSDAYSSVLALISIGFAMAVPSLVWADAAAGILVAGMISMTGVEILSESIKQLSDSTNQELVEQVDAVLQQSVADPEDDVMAVHRVRARQVGSSAIVDVQLGTAQGLSGSAVRTVEKRIRSKLFRVVPGILDADVRAQPMLEDSVNGAIATSPVNGGSAGPVGNSATGEVCPLLLADDEVSIPSASEVEQAVREEVALLQQNDVSLHRVVVNYHQTVNVNVDVTIRMSSADQTISQAKQQADALKDRLEKRSLIQSANIYLDMNYGNHAEEHTPSQPPINTFTDSNYTQADPSLSSLAP